MSTILYSFFFLKCCSHCCLFDSLAACLFSNLPRVNQWNVLYTLQCITTYATHQLLKILGIILIVSSWSLPCVCLALSSVCSNIWASNSCISPPSPLMQMWCREHIQRPGGFQFCTVLLSAGSSHFRWHWCTLSQSIWDVYSGPMCSPNAHAAFIQQVYAVSLSQPLTCDSSPGSSC